MQTPETHSPTNARSRRSERRVAADPADGEKALGARRELLDGLSVQERQVQVAGVSTYVLEAGEGPPLLMLHGPGEFTARWFRVFPGLSQRYRVVAPDLPDHGSSKVLEGRLDEARVRAWLDEFIRETCEEPPLLLGHLLGGAVAARFAAHHSDRIRGLLLVDSFGFRMLRPAPAFALALVRFMVRPTQRSYDHFMTHCLSDSARVEAELGDRWDALRRYALELARSPRVRGGMKSLMSVVGVPAIPRSELAKISVPTGLIWGRLDRAIPLKVAEAAQARYGWPLEVIDDCADDPPMERPEAFVRAVLELDRLATATG